MVYFSGVKERGLELERERIGGREKKSLQERERIGEIERGLKQEREDWSKRKRRERERI